CGIRRVERALLDVVGLQRPAVLPDEEAPSPPRRLAERLEVEDRAERHQRRDDGETERPDRSRPRHRDEALAREALAALLDQLVELRLLDLMLRRRVRLVDLLRHDQPLRDQNERGREEGEREPEREAEVRRLVADPVERDDGDEAARADRRRAEEEQQY